MREHVLSPKILRVIARNDFPIHTQGPICVLLEDRDRRAPPFTVVAKCALREDIGHIDFAVVTNVLQELIVAEGA